MLNGSCIVYVEKTVLYNLVYKLLNRLRSSVCIKILYLNYYGYLVFKLKQRGKLMDQKKLKTLINYQYAIKIVLITKYLR